MNYRTLLRDMERYASGTRCRHRTLVEYFGQRYESTDCGACGYLCKTYAEAIARGEETDLTRCVWPRRWPGSTFCRAGD